MGCSSSAPVTLPKAEIQNERFDTHYEVKEKLVRGSIAQVRRCVHKNTRHEEAVKILKSSSSQQCKKAMRELDVWKQVGAHENVVVLLDSYVESRVHYFVMQPFCSTIDEKLNISEGKFSHIELLDAFSQAFLGLAHCHSMNIVHRDIRPQNILVDIDDIVKIAEFGLAIPMPEKGGIHGMVGSVPFMSPEMVKGKTYGFETDIWSCGAVIYFFVYGENVYEAPSSSSALSLHEKRRMMTKAIANDRPRPAYKPKPGMQHPSKLMYDLIKTLLDRNVRIRPKAVECEKLISEAKGISSRKRKKCAPLEPWCQMPYRDVKSDASSPLAKGSPTNSESTRCSTATFSKRTSLSEVILEEEVLEEVFKVLEVEI